MDYHCYLCYMFNVDFNGPQRMKPNDFGLKLQSHDNQSEKLLARFTLI